MSLPPLATWPSQDAETVVRALVVAAVYVAEAEDSEGESDDRAEDTALLKALIKLREEAWVRSGLVADLADLAIDLKEHWSKWAERAFYAPQDMQTATALLHKKGADESEMKAWRDCSLFVVRSIARAASEQDSLYEAEKPKGFFARLLCFYPSKSTSSAANVSAGESSAIERIAAAFTLPK